MIRIAAFFLMVGCLLQTSCGMLRPYHTTLFQVKEAYYQSWFKNDHEKGTNVFLELTDVQQGITFDSIVFRGNMIPLERTEEDHVTKLSAALLSGVPRILNNTKPDSGPDRLIYRYMGKRCSYMLTLERKDAKYFK